MFVGGVVDVGSFCGSFCWCVVGLGKFVMINVEFEILCLELWNVSVENWYMKYFSI